MGIPGQRRKQQRAQEPWDAEMLNVCVKIYLLRREKIGSPAGEVVHSAFSAWCIWVTRLVQDVDRET